MGNRASAATSSAYKSVTTGGKSIGIVLLLIIAVIAIYIIVRINGDYNNTINDSPWLVFGTKQAQSPKFIKGDIIKQSVDGQFGIEFTYAFWLYWNDATYKFGDWKHILHKGNASAMPLQAPGFWLYPKENKIAINMNTFYSVKESCDIGNIPLNKWVHIAAIVVGKNMDVYVNGDLKKRCTFKGLPKQNYGDIYLNQWGGFSGFLSQVRYFNYALPYYKIEQILQQGPSKAPCTETGETPPYFADSWWQTTGFPDAHGFPSTSGSAAANCRSVSG